MIGIINVLWNRRCGLFLCNCATSLPKSCSTPREPWSCLLRVSTTYILWLCLKAIVGRVLRCSNSTLNLRSHYLPIVCHWERTLCISVLACESILRTWRKQCRWFLRMSFYLWRRLTGRRFVYPFLGAHSCSIARRSDATVLLISTIHTLYIIASLLVVMSHLNLAQL